MLAATYMKDRYRNNILFPKGCGLDEYLKVQEISKEVFKADKLYIPILAVYFLPEVSAKHRKELTVKWLETIPTLDNVKHLSLRHKVDQVFFEAVCNMKNL